MADPPFDRSSVRTAVVWSVVEQELGRLARAAAPAAGALQVLDAGGGTGGFAVPLARLGHDLTVVDPSPDSLAALERRAAEAGVSPRVRGVQGDAAALTTAVAGHAPARGYDLVLLHSVLEVVDDPAAVLASVAEVLGPGRATSVLAAHRSAAVLGRILAGRFDEAARLLDDPAGRWGGGDPVQRRLDEPGLRRLLAGAGLDVVAVHGVRVFADLVPGTLLDDPTAAAALLRLEAAAAPRPDLRAFAAALHVLARRQ